MKAKALLSILFALSLTLPVQINAGTISFKEKDGSVTTLANVEIISINEGTIVIEKDKKKRPYPLSSVSSFSPSDTSSAGVERSMPGEFSDYKITISDVKLPTKVSDKDKSASFEIGYSIARLNSEIPRIKVPYVYLYILVSHSTDSGEWEVLSFSYPSKAKPKGKGYDAAAIRDEVKGFDRPTRDETDHSRHGKIDLNSFGDEQVKFDLKSLKNRKILAYHIEIWGNDSIAGEKTWKDFDTRAGDKWWTRY